MANRSRIAASGSAASRASAASRSSGTAADATSHRRQLAAWRHGAAAGARGRRGRGFPRPEPGAGRADELADAAHRRPAELRRHALGRGWTVGFVAAAELAVERRCVWATVQYLAPIRAGGQLQMDIDIGGQGIALTQASGRATRRRAAGAAGDRHLRRRRSERPPVLRGARDRAAAGVPGAGAAGAVVRRDARPHRAAHAAGDGDARSARPARERPHDALDAATAEGRDVAHDVGALAVLADLAPSGISEAIGRPTFGTSLDNSIRAARLPDAQAQRLGADGHHRRGRGRPGGADLGADVRRGWPAARRRRSVGPAARLTGRRPHLRPTRHWVGVRRTWGWRLLGSSGRATRR